MLEIVHFCYQTISSYPFLLCIETTALLTKTTFLYLVLVQGLRSKKTHPAWFFLLFGIVGSMFSHIGWITSTSYRLFLPAADYRPVMFIIRLAWAFIIVCYQSLACFIETLSKSNNNFNIRQKIFITLSSLLSLSFLYIAFFEFNNINPRPENEIFLFQITYRYVFILILPSIITVLRKIYQDPLPKILNKQLKMLITGIICPVVLFDFIQLYPFPIPAFRSLVAGNLAVVSLSSLFMTYGFYYTARRVMGLRFLNFEHHVLSPGRFNFINDFKGVLTQLSFVTSLKELGHITQTFFKEAFSIPPSATRLYLRNFDADKELGSNIEVNAIETIVENFASRHENTPCAISTFLKKSKIAIYDEIVFSNFHDESSDRKELINFLDHINADIFLPIYDKNIMIAYIVVERDARKNNFYSDVDRDEMLVFASYISNIINLQQHNNINSIIQREKDLREELYKKHQEINQYKESVRTFLRDSNSSKIGIIFHKNRQFIMGNKAAQEILQINPNKDDGHQITIDLKTIVRQVESYLATQTRFSKDLDGNKIIMSALPHPEYNGTIITVYYPDISDIIKQQIDLLKNPSEWDYLLYLETTKSGQLINQLIPSSSEQLLNFKIELLKNALSKKALILEMPDADVIPTVEMLHHISLRETLYIINLKAPEQRQETLIKLFGINPIFGTNTEAPLLEKLNNTGTIFINNIHFLEPETQLYLTEYLKYGFFHVYKSDRKISSNVRIICSTNQNLQTLVQENKFDRKLFQEFKQTTISLPSLVTLPEKELATLIEGYTEQATKIQDFKNILQLTDKEKSKLYANRPVSLQEFKQKIQHILLQKSKNNNIFHETQFDPAYHISDPGLIEAARLGKKALKDPRVMGLLWSKFEKNQNRIATFLGVNRSSVNRRCKDYNLE